MILTVADGSLVIAAAGEAALHCNRRVGTLGHLTVAIAHVLEARLVHDSGAQNLRVADLHRVLMIEHFICLALQSELRDAVVGLLLPVKHVTDAQSIVGPQLEVEARTDVQPRLGVRNRGRVVIGGAAGIDELGVDNRIRLVIAVEDACEPGGIAVERAARIAH